MLFRGENAFADGHESVFNAVWVERTRRQGLHSAPSGAGGLRTGFSHGHHPRDSMGGNP